MKPEVREWLDIAESDFGTASREFALPGGPNIPAVCFHSQQCVEKLLKAVLVAHGRFFPKTHDLVELSELVVLCIPSWITPATELDALEPGAILYRYPGGMATRDDAQTAYAACLKLRSQLLPLLA